MNGVDIMRGTDVTDMKRKYRTVNAGEFAEDLVVILRKEVDLRYGENPNQPAAAYQFLAALSGTRKQEYHGHEDQKQTTLAALTDIRLAKSGKNGLSATNMMDVTRALEMLKYFKSPAVAVMKHLVPSGFATQHDNNSLASIYVAARDADARSAFGCVAVVNHPLDKSTAEAIVSTYVEGVAAPEYEEGAIGILDTKKDLRAILYSNLDKLPKFTGDDTLGLYDLKCLPTGRVVVQTPYLTSIRGVQDLVLDPMVVKKKEDCEIRYTVERDPTQQEVSDMLTAWYVNIGVRSNGIVIVKDGVTLAVGSGQQERVGAVEQAIVKAYQKAMDREHIQYNPLMGASLRYKLSSNPLKGAVVSSDAFFPFADAIELLGTAEISAIIQPGGSIRDDEVISAVNKQRMAMAFTLERCFGHF